MAASVHIIAAKSKGKIPSKHLDTVSKHAYNVHADTVSACTGNDEALKHEKSFTGTNHAAAGRNH